MLLFPASLILLPATLVAGVTYVTLGRRPPGGARKAGRVGRIAAAFFGRSMRGLLDRPEMCISLWQFWARCWNRRVQTDLDRGLFRPLAGGGAPRAGVLAAFAASGVMHVVAVLDAGCWDVT